MFERHKLSLTGTTERSVYSLLPGAYHIRMSAVLAPSPYLPCTGKDDTRDAGRDGMGGGEGGGRAGRGRKERIWQCVGCST